MSWIDGKGGFSRGLKRPRAGRVEVSGTRPKSQIATWPGHSRPFPHVVIKAWSLRRTRSALGDPVDPRDCLSSDRWNRENELINLRKLRMMDSIGVGLLKILEDFALKVIVILKTSWKCLNNALINNWNNYYNVSK